MPLSRAALLAALLLPSAARAEIDLRVVGNRIDLHARAPLTEVLDRLSRQTGLKVVYDGTPPRPLVSVSLQNATTAQAVLQLLQGLGLDYALQMDATGTRAATLVVVTSGSSGTGRPASSPTSARAQPDDEDAADAEPAEDADAEADAPAEEQPSGRPSPPPPTAATPFQSGPQPVWPGGAGVPPPAAQPGGALAPSPFTVQPSPAPADSPTPDARN